VRRARPGDRGPWSGLAALGWGLVGFLAAQAAAAKYTGLVIAAATLAVAALAVRRRGLGGVAAAASALGAAIVIVPW